MGPSTLQVSPGKALALQSLSGQATERVPVALFTWGYDYLWIVAGLDPWQLALGGSETWHRAHMALLDRHGPDIVLYSGAGNGPLEPTLVQDLPDRWIVRDENLAREFVLRRRSLALYEAPRAGHAGQDPGPIRTCEDADRRIPEFGGWGETYLNGLRRLIREAGDRALVVPHHSPGYICACYTLGFERSMIAMKEEPDFFHHVAGRFQRGDARSMEELRDAGAEAVLIADSWSSCDVLSPDMVARFVIPYQRSMVEAARRVGLKTILWTEGNILPILDQEAALPIDAFSFDQSRKGHDIRVDAIRSAFGPSRCVWGNMDAELLLMRNDPDEIASETRSQIRQSGKGCPFVLFTGSPLPSNISPTAVDAMMKAAAGDL